MREKSLGPVNFYFTRLKEITFFKRCLEGIWLNHVTRLRVLSQITLGNGVRDLLLAFFDLRTNTRVSRFCLHEGPLLTLLLP